jgi:hypothetical protein
MKLVIHDSFISTENKLYPMKPSGAYRSQTEMNILMIAS